MEPEDQKQTKHRETCDTDMTEKCGFGLIAKDEIKKGQFVIEYVGEVIDDRTCEERLWKMKRQRYTNFYLCEVSSNMVIDATNKGNKSRFINHSCEPNTEMQKWTVDGETRVGIFALRDIERGEELTYDYKFVQFGADQDCHCGSSNCRKMVGTSKSFNSFVLHNGNSGSSQDQHDIKKRKTTSDNCIGEIIRLWDRRDKMYAFTTSNLVDDVRCPFICCFQLPARFNPLSFNILPFRYVPAVVHDYDEYTGLHTLLLDEETTEKFDMREEDWDFLPPWSWMGTWHRELQREQHGVRMEKKDGSVRIPGNMGASKQTENGIGQLFHFQHAQKIQKKIDY
ncbi:histone-lysine N-methyltransferase ASHH3-like isoform X7 [Hordeum vulgare subsp. vulgare]|uniref:histone-lysine N-methyltransferase ASHH3-like isoform X7 n=1 Tax=Hordeum vulgare subsp. vulgare TaxID=112509 RepID=UPI001D1A3772|nr:histone-lysine N-methyltransferase ASHH3-like isoform X7 [Hordeum vulgare subsp. vulgare]